ncbi:MAG: hypothetical protein ACYC4E_02660 [Carboxydocellales bacterium]
MSKQLIIPPEERVILLELLRIQEIYDETVALGDEVLTRLHRYDLTRLWERLHVSTCEVCYHGKELAKPMDCRWWNRCKSYLRANESNEINGQTSVTVTLVFEID